jgi:hypothetical protein
MERNCNWDMSDVGKKVINECGQVGTFIARCDYPSFTVEFENGNRVDAAINSPMGRGWKIVDGLPDVDKKYLINFLENVLKIKVKEVKFDSEENNGDYI